MSRSLAALSLQYLSAINMAEWRHANDLDIPDAVYRRLKARAAREGSSAKALILRGVARVLKEQPRTSQRRVTGPIVPSRRPGTMRLDMRGSTSHFFSLYPRLTALKVLAGRHRRRRHGGARVDAEARDRKTA